MRYSVAGFLSDLTLVRELQYPRADVERERVGLRTFLLDQFHRRLRIMSLGDENARAHRHPAVDSARAVGIHLAAVLDRLQRGFGSAAQRPDGDWNQRRVKGRQPEKLQWICVHILARTILHAHVDDQFHAEFAQVVVIHSGRCSADEEVIGDGGEIHVEHLITGFYPRPLILFFSISYYQNKY